MSFVLMHVTYHDFCWPQGLNENFDLKAKWHNWMLVFFSRLSCHSFNCSSGFRLCLQRQNESTGIEYKTKWWKFCWFCLDMTGNNIWEILRIRKHSKHRTNLLLHVLLKWASKSSTNLRLSEYSIHGFSWISSTQELKYFANKYLRHNLRTIHN